MNNKLIKIILLITAIAFIIISCDKKSAPQKTLGQAAPPIETGEVMIDECFPEQFAAINSDLDGMDIDELIITIVKALQTRDETTLNRLIHPDYGIVILTGNSLQWPHFKNSISFSDDSVYWILPSEPLPNVFYHVSHEALPVIDFDDESYETTWDKPAGIYCQTGGDPNIWSGSLSGLIENVTELIEEGVVASELASELLQADAMAKAHIFDGNSDNSYTILAMNPEYYSVIRFTLTLIDGKRYLSLINMYYAF